MLHMHTRFSNNNRFLVCYFKALEICKRRILSLNGLPGMPQHYTDNERTMHLASIVPFENTNMVSALLDGIQNTRITIYLHLISLIYFR